MSVLNHSAILPLRVERVSSTTQFATTQTQLGALDYGQLFESRSTPTENPRANSATPETVDIWSAGRKVESGVTGEVRWRSDGQWMFGVIDLEETNVEMGLQAITRQAYGDLFRSLRETGCIQLLRVWNYLPQINADGGGLERYRQFNIGRQEAFVEDGRAMVESAPAACALGKQGNIVSLRFLAGRIAPLPVENPRLVPAYYYPPDYGPVSPTFSRAGLVESSGEVLLFISGTASTRGHETVHHDDVHRQTEETVQNVRAITAAASQKTTCQFNAEELQCVVYVRNFTDQPVVRRVLEAEFGAQSRTCREAIYLEADICRSDLLLEIEAHASAHGRITETRTRPRPK